MYPFSYLPKPLGHTDFYVLLVLADKALHAYAIKGAVANASLGSVLLRDGKLYPILTRLAEEGWIEGAGEMPAGKSGKLRVHYRTSEGGLIRLRDEAQRIKHAVEILRTQGLLENDVPTDIQRRLLEHRLRSQD